jgi:hypothetical protein
MDYGPHDSGKLPPPSSAVHVLLQPRLTRSLPDLAGVLLRQLAEACLLMEARGLHTCLPQVPLLVQLHATFPLGILLTGDLCPVQLRATSA